VGRSMPSRSCMRRARLGLSPVRTKSSVGSGTLDGRTAAGVTVAGGAVAAVGGAGGWGTEGFGSPEKSEETLPVGATGLCPAFFPAGPCVAAFAVDVVAIGGVARGGGWGRWGRGPGGLPRWRLAAGAAGAAGTDRFVLTRLSTRPSSSFAAILTKTWPRKTARRRRYSASGRTTSCGTTQPWPPPCGASPWPPCVSLSVTPLL
jgi:hypothetical protein